MLLRAANRDNVLLCHAYAFHYLSFLRRQESPSPPFKEIPACAGMTKPRGLI
jgi:hypothetical protein